MFDSDTVDYDPMRRENAMATNRAPPWKKPRPKSLKAPRTLTVAQKSAAKARADAAGRRYPNLVDNIWAAKHAVSKKPHSAE